MDWRYLFLGVWYDIFFHQYDNTIAYWNMKNKTDYSSKDEIENVWFGSGVIYNT